MIGPSVSVVMPVWNGEQFLAEAVESILNQSLRDLELVVVDDGSTDSSPALLADIAARDKRVRVITQPNGGIVAALNVGCSVAFGRFIARLDCDDVSHPERLRKQADFLESHQSVGLLGTAATYPGANGLRSTPAEGRGDHDSVVSRLLLGDNPFVHSSIMMRTAVFSRSGGYRLAALDAEDLDLWLRMAEISQLAILEEPLVDYRWHGNQVSVRKIRQQAVSTLAAVRAAQIRRSGGTDPLETSGPATVDLLENIGVSRIEYEQRLFRSACNQARELNSLGSADAAGQMVDTAVSLLPRVNAATSERSRLLWEHARRHYHAQNYWVAAKSAIRASLLEPWLPFQAVHRRVRGA